VLKQFYGQGKVYSDVLDYLNMIFTGVFTIEFILKLYAFRIKVSWSVMHGFNVRWAAERSGEVVSSQCDWLIADWLYFVLSRLLLQDGVFILLASVCHFVIMFVNLWLL